MEFSVMTYNIRLGLESNIETVAGIIGEADVVAVQEVGYDWIEGEKGSHPQMLSRASGLLHFRFASSMTVKPGTDPPEIVAAPTAEDRPGFGVALLSRFPLGPWTRHRLPKRRNGQRCILSATVVTPSGPVTVLVTHLSSQAEDRPSQVQALLRHAQTQATPLIVMGDMSASVTEESMLPMSVFLSNAGGDNPMPSFPADAPEIATDHIYISKELKIVQPSMALPMMGSSHLPVMARLSL